MEKFEVGERVLVNHEYNGQSISKIDSITPKGFYKIGESLYNPDNLHLRGGSIWSINFIEKLTPEKYKSFMIKRNKSILRQTDWEKISDDKTEKIIEILKEGI